MGNGELAGRVEGVGTEVYTMAVEAVVSGDSGAGGPGAEMVEGQLSHREELVPEVGGERGVGSGEEGNEVVLRRANRAFGWIRTVIRGGDKLVGEVA